MDTCIIAWFQPGLYLYYQRIENKEEIRSQKNAQINTPDNQQQYQKGERPQVSEA